VFLGRQKHVRLQSAVQATLQVKLLMVVMMEVMEAFEVPKEVLEALMHAFEAPKGLMEVLMEVPKASMEVLKYALETQLEAL
jgi:hypothetical protein